ncbi:pheromone maturation dipeptidyl aminopeptidase DapB [Paecilomyces variotii]|uniref:dipeptidyl-peptidase IV n=1 Tax=Byssochlamys spectabilis TaxID=264951 RepID=A0A443HWV5_BYSSP|nr:pheromone maturation dipeptidyl aminopeptidase DapB [Paecilomyces variotii]RWQ96309.1 pheromone maturation dipeptidyl aminopeptidase DapB [Paecilomyces variotii]
MDRRSSHEESVPLTQRSSSPALPASDSESSSDESMFFDDNRDASQKLRKISEHGRYRDLEEGESGVNAAFLPNTERKATPSKTRRILWVLGILCVGGWVLSFFLFLGQKRAGNAATGSAAVVYAADSESTTNYGKPVTLEQVLTGQWYPRSHAISWIAGPDGEDGLLLERGGGNEQEYLRVEDVRYRNVEAEHKQTRVLMNSSYIHVNGETITPSRVWPSPDLKTVLVLSDEQKNWRHSFTGRYWLFDVDTQTAQPLDPSDPDARVQLASWSPLSDAVVFTKKNNMYLRKLLSSKVVPITTDGGKNLFYGVPDWVYEEEVFSGNSVTWWAEDGKYIAFLRTDEATVPEYPVQYFMSRPSGKTPPPGLENYPEVRRIKYPKAGSPNPTVNLQFYDVEKGEVFSVDVSQDFPDEDRLIIEVLWTANENVLVRETNRESDVLKVILIDTASRTGSVVRSDDIASLDGGWVEPTQSTRYIPAAPEKGRTHDGYIDVIPHEGYDHLAYFTPLDNPTPTLLTSGEWEVVGGPAAVDLENDIVYFIATKEGPTQRHVYSVKLDGSDLKPITNTSEIGYYGASFSKGGGYVLMTYAGPSVPWQAVKSTPSNNMSYTEVIEENQGLAQMVKDHALPVEVYQNVTIDGYTLQVVERRPPHFNPRKKYPVLFHLYGGPGSQTVDRTFGVDFHSYIASSLGYIVVTVDGRGTGFIGRKARCIVRDNLGHYEARDQIETAKIWAAKSYVDETRMAIWGWSYGGFMTLKTLEQDAGKTFQYGMAVAPVTDWRFYDSIYTERYMHTPEHNPSGYDNASISDVSALRQTVRFLVIHGVADDNVHLQNSLSLIDKLDLAGVENYDVHVYPDSDHSIYFHNAHRMVYDRKCFPIQR